MINDFNKCGKLRDGSALKDCKMFPVGRAFAAFSIFPASFSDSVQFSSSFFLSMAHYQFSQHHLSNSLQQPFFAAPSIHSCYQTCARPIQFKMKTANSLFVGSAIFVRGVYNQFLGPSLPFGYRL